MFRRDFFSSLVVPGIAKSAQLTLYVATDRLPRLLSNKDGMPQWRIVLLPSLLPPHVETSTDMSIVFGF